MAFGPYLRISKQLSERNETARAPVRAHFSMHLRISYAFECECVAYACVDFTTKMLMLFFTLFYYKNAIFSIVVILSVFEPN